MPSLHDAPAFVIPHWSDNPTRTDFLRQTIVELFNQTDMHWRLIIADDASTDFGSRSLTRELSKRHPDRVFVVRLPQNQGPGCARNVGVSRARAINAPFVLFQDDDDLPNLRRVEITAETFRRRPDVDFVYSGFIGIDEHNTVLPRDQVRIDMIEVLEAIDRSPVEGSMAWVEIASQTGFISTTSTVAVRTDVAASVPFPPERVSEDSHTWLRMSAFGARFAFLPSIPTRYRMRRHQRSDLGCNGRGSGFLRLKVRNDADGLVQAIALAIARRDISPSRGAEIGRRFLHRVASYVEHQGEAALGEALRARADGSDPSVLDALRGVASTPVAATASL